MSERVVRLVGGSRDGGETRVDSGVLRLLTAAEAPGMLEVYEPTGEPDVWQFVDLVSAAGIAPEMLHTPLI